MITDQSQLGYLFHRTLHGMESCSSLRLQPMSLQYWVLRIQCTMSDSRIVSPKVASLLIRKGGDLGLKAKKGRSGPSGKGNGGWW